MRGGVQIPFNGLPLDPAEVAKLDIFARIQLYNELGLHPLERAAAEEAVRLIVAGRYPRGKQ